MSTNFYHRTNICGHCDRYDSIHIGKRFGAGDGQVSFTFHGYLPDGYGEQLPITSWTEWKETLRVSGEVWDEYGVQVGVEDFIAEVEEVPQDKRSVWPLIGRDWRDREGFGFNGYDFS